MHRRASVSTRTGEYRSHFLKSLNTKFFQSFRSFQMTKNCVHVLKPWLLKGCIWKWALWEVIGLRWGHNGGALMMGLVTNMIRHQRVCFLSLSHVGIQREGGHWGIELAGTLILYFLASRVMRNKFLLCKSPSVCYHVRTAKQTNKFC